MSSDLWVSKVARSSGIRVSFSIAQPVCAYRNARNHAIKKGNPLGDTSMSPAPPLAPVARNAPALIGCLSIPDIRTFRIVERLCGEKQRTKKHDNPHDECARPSRSKPKGESKQSRSADGIQVPWLLQSRNSVANRGRLVSHSSSGDAPDEEGQTMVLRDEGARGGG